MNEAEHVETMECRECESPGAAYAVKDVEVTRRGLTTVVTCLAGWFCPHCGEIEFDESTDSGDRFAAAGDALVLRARERAGKAGQP